MYPLTWLELVVVAVLLTALNVFVIFWLTRSMRRDTLTADAEREALRAEVEILREENARWRSALAQPATDRSAASPYSRAIEMARNGAEISTIAGTCGISRGEAELLVALHRSGISSS